MCIRDRPRMGIEVTMADVRDPESYQNAVQENTKVLYVETMTNPTLKVCDLGAMAEVAKKNGLVSVVDNTFASPWSCRPIEMGFDIVLHSGTKYLGGHADLTAGFATGRNDLIEQIFHHKIVSDLYYFFLLLFVFFDHVHLFRSRIKHYNLPIF